MSKYIHIAKIHKNLTLPYRCVLYTIRLSNFQTGISQQKVLKKIWTIFSFAIKNQTLWQVLCCIPHLIFYKFVLNFYKYNIYNLHVSYIKIFSHSLSKIKTFSFLLLELPLIQNICFFIMLKEIKIWLCGGKTQRKYPKMKKEKK